LDFKAYDVVFLDIGIDAILRKRRKNGVKMEFPFVGGKRQVLLEDIIYIEAVLISGGLLNKKGLCLNIFIC